MMQSVLEKAPDLSYRSHKLQKATSVEGGRTGGFDSFNIRPPYFDRALNTSRWTAPAEPVSGYSTTDKRTMTAMLFGNGHSSRPMITCTPHSELSGNGVTGVTGIPNLVELDDALNTLDPGQLLRESAAAATRAALQSDHPRSTTSAATDPIQLLSERRRKSSRLVSDLLQRIYQKQYNNVCDVGNGCKEEEALSSVVERSTNAESSARFSPKCAEPLKRKGTWELEVMRDHLREALSRVATLLIQQLTQRDRLLQERDRHCDIITAILQAASPKRSQDTKMRFSVEPPINSLSHSTSLSTPCSSSSSSSQHSAHHISDTSGFQQWHDAMRMVARLPGGVPPEFRRKLWLTLAEQHLLRIGVDWSDVEHNCFNDRINPDDEDLGAQIVRDLHRTGCSLFCGDDALPNQALLKRVLLAYARWNKAVGYCQGLNVLAALLLEVMNRSEVESLKVMIYLIEGVLPPGYFANNLRGLSIDMAVFRDLLRQRLPALSRHLEMLQQADSSTGSSSYCIEPPLTNVFTMQWFLTLFATCLPKAAVLRVWDLIFLEGNDVLLRTALAIWQTLAERILTVRTCDDFYSIMAVLAREMLEFGLMESNHLVQTIVSMAPFPFPGLNELRDKYRYNITPWNGGSGRIRLFYSDDDADIEADEDEDDEKTTAMNAVATVFGGLMTSSSLFRHTGRRITDITFRKSSSQHLPSSPSSTATSSSSHEKEKLQLDIAALRKQYAKLRERQKQAHVMFWTVATSSDNRPNSVDSGSSSNSSSGINPVTHLLAGRKPLLIRRPSASSPSSSSSSSHQNGPKLKLPPPRIPIAGTCAIDDNKAYFSAPTTPSDKTDHQQSFSNGDWFPETSKPSKVQNKQRITQQRRNSGSATSVPSNIRQQCQTVQSLSQPGPGSMTVNRSRLVQELLEQNSAMLQKLKDRTEGNVNMQSEGGGAINSHNCQSSSWKGNYSDGTRSTPSAHHHHPFPNRQNFRPMKDITIRLGLNNSTGNTPGKH